MARDSADCDAIGLRPTLAGLAKLREAAAEIDQRLGNACASLSERDLDTLVTLLGRLADCVDSCAKPLAGNLTEA